MWVELAGEDFVSVGGVYTISNLLYSCHSILIVDFDVWLSTGNSESSLIVGIVDGVILVLVVEHNVLDLVA